MVEFMNTELPFCIWVMDQYPKGLEKSISTSEHLGLSSTHMSAYHIEEFNKCLLFKNLK